MRRPLAAAVLLVACPLAVAACLDAPMFLDPATDPATADDPDRFDGGLDRAAAAADSIVIEEEVGHRISFTFTP